jgi:acyl-CoA thioester hydrolase
MSDLLADYPVIITIPVQWGEMDAYGHVNNAVHFRYFESGRVAYLDECGFLETYDTERIGAILHSTECRYRQALQYPDTVLVGTRVTSVEEDRFTMRHCAVAERDGVVAAEGSAIVVSFDYSTRTKTALPESVRRRIAEMESR